MDLLFAVYHIAMTHYRPFVSEKEMAGAAGLMDQRELRADPRFFIDEDLEMLYGLVDTKEETSLFLIPLESNGLASDYIFCVDDSDHEIDQFRHVKECFIGMILARRLGLEEAAHEFEGTALSVQHFLREDDDVEVVEYLS